jgi:P22_AR N-terminal domain
VSARAKGKPPPEETSPPAQKRKAAPLVRVAFHGDQLQAVRDGDKVWVPIRRISEVFDLSHQGQFERLRGAPWAVIKMILTVAEDGKVRETACLDLDSFPMWLATIQPGRVKAEQRERLGLYQREAARVLRDHFFGAPSTSSLPSLDEIIAKMPLEQREELARLEVTSRAYEALGAKPGRPAIPRASDHPSLPEPSRRRRRPRVAPLPAPSPAPALAMPEPASPLALLPPGPGLERHLADALLLLGPSLDPRLRSALISASRPQRPTVEHYLRLAAALTEALADMPGVLQVDTPEHRLDTIEAFLAETENVLRLLAAEPPVLPMTYQAVSGVKLGIDSATSHCEALAGLPNEDPLRARLGRAYGRVVAATEKLAALFAKQLAPAPAQGSPGAAPAPTSAASPRAPRRGRPPRQPSGTRSPSRARSRGSVGRHGMRGRLASTRGG